MLEDCLALRRGLGNPVEIAATLSTLALYRLQSGDPAAAAVGEREALQMFRALGDRVGEAIAREHLGRIALCKGDDGDAIAELRHALAIAREIAHHEVEGTSELLLGEAAFAAGDLIEAASHFGASLMVCRDAGDRRGEANALRWLGKVDLESGSLSTARQRLSDALRAFEEFEIREELAACMEDHAALLLREGLSEDAARLAGAADQAHVRMAQVRTPREERRWLALLERLRTALPDDKFKAAWQLGQGWETKEAVRAALNEREVASISA